MSRTEILQIILKIIINYEIYCVAVYSKNRNHTSDISAELDDILSTIPKWLLPEIIRKNKSVVEFENGSRIFLASNVCRIKGISLSDIYVYDTVDDKTHAVLLQHLRCGQSSSKLIYFKD